MKTINTKTFATRDSAVASLRKMGIAKENYSDFIAKKNDKFEVDLESARLSLLPKQVVKSTAKKSEAKKPAEKKQATKKVEAKASDEKTSISATILTLIGEEKSNKEIWEIVQPQFDLSDDKKWYPGWYRASFVRKGLI